MKIERYVERLKNRFQAWELALIENPSFTVKDMSRICGQVYCWVDDIRAIREVGEPLDNGDYEYMGIIWCPWESEEE